jgi:hypothetical protein
MERARGLDATCDANEEASQIFLVVSVVNPLKRLDSKK